MHSVEISIIIPFYNVNEILFTRCIDSIKASTFTDYEVIIVNDGSKESYKSIFDFIRGDKRFKIFEIENSGVSMARNFGTNLATGRYITYIDADDCIAPDFLEHVFCVAQETNAEIVFTGTKLISSEELINIEYSKKTRNKIGKYVICGTKEFSNLKRHMIDQQITEYAIFDDQAYFGRGCYARLLDSKLAKSVNFPANIEIGEDIIWHYRILQKNPVTAMLFESNYFYIVNNSSVTREISEKMCKKREKLVALALEEIGESSAVYELVWQQLWGIITGYLYSNECHMSIKEKNVYISNLLKKKEWSELISNRQFLSKRSRVLLEIVRKGWIFVYLWSFNNCYYPFKNKVKKIIGRE